MDKHENRATIEWSKMGPGTVCLNPPKAHSRQHGFPGARTDMKTATRDVQYRYCSSTTVRAVTLTSATWTA